VITKPAELEDEVYTKSISEKLPAGTYTFAVWAQALDNGASVTLVIVDSWKESSDCLQSIIIRQVN